MADHDVSFLNVLRDFRRDCNANIGELRDGASGLAGQADRHNIVRPAVPDRPHDILRISRGRNPDQHISRTAERLDLPLKNAVESEIVGAGGEQRAIGSQGDRGEAGTREGAV